MLNAHTSWPSGSTFRNTQTSPPQYLGSMPLLHSKRDVESKIRNCHHVHQHQTGYMKANMPCLKELHGKNALFL